MMTCGQEQGRQHQYFRFRHQDREPCLMTRPQQEVASIVCGCTVP